MKKSWLPGLDSNSQPFGSQLGGIKLLVPRLVSLTSLIAVYPALELDGSWTEPLRQLPSPCTQQPSSLQQKSFANRRHGRSAREKARQGQRSRYQWPERRRCP